jgi:hypothetical protein
LFGFLLRSVLAAAATLAAAAIMAPAAGAVPLTASPLMEASPTNLLAGCAADGSGVNFPDSEVEPYVDVNPTDTDNIVGGYQQDRYSNGGAKGNVASVSLDGGATWTQVAIPAHNRCTGPTARFERGTDPWVSFGPSGAAHFMTLSIDPDPPTGGFGDNAMVYNRSTDGGLTWEAPIILKEDTDPRFLNDKNAITADPNDASFVYAVWDRLETPRGELAAAPQGRENIFGLGFKGPAWFTRTTNGGDSWEPARIIYATGANNQTIGNQIVVLPAAVGGDVLNFFNETLTRPGFRIFLSFVRSTNRGATWDRRATRVSQVVPMDRVREDGVIDSEPVPARTRATRAPARSAPVTSSSMSRWTAATATSTRSGRTPASVDSATTRSRSRSRRTAARAGRRRCASTPAPTPALASTTGRRSRPRSTWPTTAPWESRSTTSATTPRPTASSPPTSSQFIRHASCSEMVNWAETQVTPTSFDMRRAPFARGYFVGDYEGLGFVADDGDATAPGDAFASFFSQSHPGDPASAFLSRLAP